jgi:hypothetical protein
MVVNRLSSRRRKSQKNRKGLAFWRKSFMSSEKRLEWKKAEAIKKRLIITAKKSAWSTIINNLNPQSNNNHVWPFMRAMIGQGNNCIPIAPAIQKSNGVSLTAPKDIADSFLDFFSNPPDSQSNYSIEEATLAPIINSHKANNVPNQLHLLFKANELESALVKIKSRSTGPDNIGESGVIWTSFCFYFVGRFLITRFVK